MVLGSIPSQDRYCFDRTNSKLGAQDRLTALRLLHTGMYIAILQLLESGDEASAAADPDGLEAKRRRKGVSRYFHLI